MIAWSYRNLGRREEARALLLVLKAELETSGQVDAYVDDELALLAD
jgi:hypothetical protein